MGAEAAQTRSKLAERGEKLGAINQLTMEMQGALSKCCLIEQTLCSVRSGDKAALAVCTHIVCVF